jgi:hypothetical protein
LSVATCRRVRAPSFVARSSENGFLRRKVARVTVGDAPADIESIVPFTRVMIEHEWPQIQLIASELVRQRQLSYDEVVRVIQR